MLRLNDGDGRSASQVGRLSCKEPLTDQGGMIGRTAVSGRGS